MRFTRFIRIGFSALQRAEIAEMRYHAGIGRWYV